MAEMPHKTYSRAFFRPPSGLPTSCFHCMSLVGLCADRCASLVGLCGDRFIGLVGFWQTVAALSPMLRGVDGEVKQGV
uniref:Uncharacterized protein n=1 Tax=Anguilla anguilla TaxID=7936 RepID=A0A0E9PH79_ANGAN